VSNQLAHLERLVGLRLVERSRGTAPVALTDAGRLLLQHIERVLERLEAAQADLEALAEGRTGTLRVGAFHSAAARLLPEILPAFATSCPDVRIEPVEAHTDTPLLELLERGEIDLAFCELPLVEEGFDGVELMEDPFVLLVSAESELARRRRPPSLAAVAALPFVGFNQSRAQTRMLEALSAQGIAPVFQFRTDLNATVQSLVAADIGVAIVPSLTINPSRTDTKVIEVPELPARGIALIWRKDRPWSRTAEIFTDVARATCAELARAEREDALLDPAALGRRHALSWALGRRESTPSR
jgi:DNA-binding transcriptional LysR family regulator